MDETTSTLTSVEPSEMSRDNDSFSFSTEMTQSIDSKLLDVKNSKKYPYIGIRIVNFLFGDEEDEYISFFIDRNFVATLASNLTDKNKDGQTKTIITTCLKGKSKINTYSYSTSKT